MAEIRINKLLKQFNIGLSDLVEFLRKKGFEVEENPNAKVSDGCLPDLHRTRRPLNRPSRWTSR